MVSRDEVRRLLGELDDEKVADILKLGPTLQELELAAVCLDGWTDSPLESRHHLSGTAARILETDPVRRRSARAESLSDRRQAR